MLFVLPNSVDTLLASKIYLAPDGHMWLQLEADTEALADDFDFALATQGGHGPDELDGNAR